MNLKITYCVDLHNKIFIRNLGGGGGGIQGAAFRGIKLDKPNLAQPFPYPHLLQEIQLTVYTFVNKCVLLRPAVLFHQDV